MSVLTPTRRGSSADPLGRCCICERAYLRLNHKQTKCADCRENRTTHAQRICQQCKTIFAPRHGLQRWCSADCKDRGNSGVLHSAYAPSDPKPCPTCLSTLTDKHGSNCSECARTSRRERKHRERARKRTCHKEPYTLAEIAARDHNTCGLCGMSVPMHQTVPHPKAPTIDHIVPLFHGGADAPFNVQLAHFLCNSTKGTRGTQQLRAF